MTRRLLNLLTLLSLVLCVAVVVLWARSYAVADEVHLLGRGRGYYLESSRGRLMFFASDTPVVRPVREWGYGRYGDAVARRAAMADIERNVAARGGAGFRAFGVAFLRKSSPTGAAVVVAAPAWLLVASLGLGPLLRIALRRRATPGTCPACGYDLRATPDRCPECGHTPTERPLEAACSTS